jgi:hypothetical protein
VDFVCGFAASVLHALLMLAVARLRLKLPALVVQIALAASIQGIVALALAATGMLGSYWHFASAFAFGFMTYLFCFSALYKSISLRILVHIADQPGGTATLDTIFQRVVVRSFTQRAEALIALGLVRQVASEYEATTAGRQVSRRIIALRQLLGCEGGGIYFKSDGR